MESVSTGRLVELAVISGSPVTATQVRELLVTLLPGVETRTLDPTETRLALDGVDGVVIDAHIPGESGVSLLRRIRASGYAGAAVLLIEPPIDAEWKGDAAALGARCVSRQADAESLAQTVVDALASASGDPAATATRDALHRTRRLIAAGELALRLQHSLNNPLAALLAEAQLLEMEQLDPEHQEAVERIVELCRRMVEIVRRLDGVSAEATPAAGSEGTSASPELPGATPRSVSG